MLGGSELRLLVLTGTIPLPPGVHVTDALRQVQVTSEPRGDAFQLTFAVSKGLLDYALVDDPALQPFNRVVIAAVFGVVPQVIIDGVITHVQLTPTDRPGQGTLTVTGRDISLMLDLEERNAEYPNQPDFVIFSQLIARYAQYGLVPVPTSTTDVPIMIDRVPRQNETDLRFIQRLAERNGFVFSIEPVAVGVSQAWFGPEQRLGVPQRALTLNMGEASNVDRIDFRTDALAPADTNGQFIEPFLKMALPTPQLPSLRVPPLAARSTAPRRTRLMRRSGNESISRVAVRAVAEATNTPDALTGTTQVDTTRYGGVIRARRLIGVRGAGYTHDGFYYVRSVRHDIRIGGYTQSVTLSREGTGALLPMVVP